MMTQSIMEISTPVIFEGGMGTLLMERGLPSGAPGETFNIERPDIVEQIHRDYGAAGAQVHITNTFNGSRIRLRLSGLEDQIEAVNKAGVRLARAASDGKRFVAGSIGPTGELLAPLGTLSREEAVDVFAEQASFLVAGGADLLLIETMTDLNEAQAAVAGCRQCWDGPLAALMSFSQTPRGFFTMMGNAATDSVKALADAGANVVGANCQLTAEQMVPLAEELRTAGDLPLLFEPNAGQPEVTGSGVRYAQSPDDFAVHVARLVQAGASWVGGCCGTTPEFITAARDALAQV